MRRSAALAPRECGTRKTGGLRCAGAGELVVAAWRPSLVARTLHGLPAGADESRVLEPAEDGIDRPAGESGGVEDVEAVAGAAGEGDEDEGGGAREAGHERGGRVLETERGMRKSCPPPSAGRRSILVYLCRLGAMASSTGDS